ncbi:MAG: carboxynorspermidine decarboxylase [Veillonellaceae bacterium]|nr:carboxynorspermidine decarboxylase [Veillonellaceae bacterium]
MAAMEKQPAWLQEVATPAYVIDEKQLIHNLEILKGVQDRTGCSILLAQKAFSMYACYPLIAKYLKGAAASGLFEARLAYEEFPGENHVFNPAFQDKEFSELLQYCDHFVFNSVTQWKKFRERALAVHKECGLRINPEHSTQDHAIYDPCSPLSRLGARISEIQPEELEGLTGFHFHTLCEQGAEPLAETLEAVEEKFGKYLPQLKWINFGGGHHITKGGYNIPLLEKCINRMQEKYGLKVYLEPGEAVALNAGFLITEVLELIEGPEREMPVAILDASAACHMPDVIEMPYRPPLFNSGEEGEKTYSYMLAGATCLAGDNIGIYSFDKPLQCGQRLVFGDMAIYTMVKNNTFNGMALPDIYYVDSQDKLKCIKKFAYENFKCRL